MKLQLQPIETAPKDMVDIMLKLRSKPLLCIGWYMPPKGYWTTGLDDSFSDSDIEGWAVIPDYELPPKSKTLREEIKDSVVAFDNDTPISDALERIDELFDKHKGETIE